MIALCETFDLASINRGPLAMGILTGKFTPRTTFREDDMRHGWGWDFRQGPLAERLQAVEHLREVLTSQGRTLAQGAVAWIWARSERTIPIPGFKTVSQVEENIGAMKFGPLSDEQMRQIDEILGRQNEYNETARSLEILRADDWYYSATSGSKPPSFAQHPRRGRRRVTGKPRAGHGAGSNLALYC